MVRAVKIPGGVSCCHHCLSRLVLLRAVPPLMLLPPPIILALELLLKTSQECLVYLQLYNAVIKRTHSCEMCVFGSPKREIKSLLFRVLQAVPDRTSTLLLLG
jgi:hypothetical protein